MIRSAPLTRQEIAQAALTVIDRDGLSALTMRALGKELGLSAMALYNHVGNRAELECLVAEAVIATVDVSPRPGRPMLEVHRLMTDLRAALIAHHNAVPLILTRPTSSQAALAPIEALLAALARSGFRDHELLCAYRTLFAYLIGSVQADLTAPVRSGEPGKLDEVVAGVLRLPEESFPHLRACAVIAGSSDADVEFAYGLDAILRGLRRTARR